MPWVRDGPNRGRERGPGRALRGVSCFQRGRLDPAHRHFGLATPGTRTNDATPNSYAWKTKPLMHLDATG